MLGVLLRPPCVRDTSVPPHFTLGEKVPELFFSIRPAGGIASSFFLSILPASQLGNINADLPTRKSQAGGSVWWLGEGPAGYCLLVHVSEGLFLHAPRARVPVC